MKNLRYKIIIENILRYLCNYNDFKKEKKEEKKLTRTNLIKLLVNIHKNIDGKQTQTYPEEFVEDDVDIGRAMFFEKKFDLDINKMQPQTIIQKKDISKTVDDRPGC